MLNKKAVICMIITILIFIPAMYVNSDSSSLFRVAETVQPIQNNNVSMVEEKVDIQVYGGWSVARCEFLFRNESQEEQKVLMGFPASLIGEGWEIDNTTKLSDFRTYDEGVEKEAKLEKAGDESIEPGGIAEWYTWDVQFQGGEERKIVNTYKTKNYDAPWGRHTGYILKTGAPWKGNIGKAVITFELMDIAPSNIYEEYTSPKGYKIDKNKIIWEMEDFEPSEDIIIEMSGYMSIYDLIHMRDEEKSMNVRKQIEQSRLLFMNGNEEESLKQINQLLQQGIYAEELYFCLLNYYHKQGDIDGFIRILEDEIQQLNSPIVLQWAEVLYPDRLKAEGITYQKEHKPSIKNQFIRKLNDAQLELCADLFDEAGDMTFFYSGAYDNRLTRDSLLEVEDNEIVFGQENYEYRSKGKLPDSGTDLVWMLDVSDYKGNTASGLTLSDERPGNSCYHYNGSTFELWSLYKNNIFTLCHYDKSFEPMKEEYGRLLASRLQSIMLKLDINLPAGGYTINLYKKSDISRLKRESPQNITLYLKEPEYKAKLHNAAAEGKSEKAALEEWDWGEIIAEIDTDNMDNMTAGIFKEVLADNFGIKWQDVKPEILTAFIAAASEEPGKGSYYAAFSRMTKAELIEAAQEIGSTGKAEAYASPYGKWAFAAIAVILAVGIIYAISRKYLNKKYIS